MRISTPEFVAIMAMLVATVALSTDGILPALTMIANDMTPDDHNRAQFVLSFFVVGMAAGTFVMGPLSDSFGRKRVIYSGAVMYIFCALICATTDNYNLLLLARIGQGIGAAAPRVVAQALIRDFYQGREMARISSFVMIIFASVPALAPLLGSFVMLAFEWQAIFGLFILFVAISTIWMAVRIDESMPAHKRIPFRVRTISAAVKEVLKYSVIVTSIIGLIFAYCILFVAIFLVQPVFDQVYDRSASFPYWFAFDCDFVRLFQRSEFAIGSSFGDACVDQRCFSCSGSAQHCDAVTLVYRRFAEYHWVRVFCHMDFFAVLYGWNDNWKFDRTRHGTRWSHRRHSGQRNQCACHDWISYFCCDFGPIL